MLKEKRVNIQLEEALHKQLKLVCVLKNIPIKDYVKSSIAEAIGNNTKLLEEIKDIEKKD